MWMFKLMPDTPFFLKLLIERSASMYTSRVRESIYATQSVTVLVLLMMKDPESLDAYFLTAI